MSDVLLTWSTPARVSFVLLEEAIKMADDTQVDAEAEARVLQKANDKLSQPGDPALLPGESILVAAKNVTLLDPFNGPLKGTLFLTSYKLSFITTDLEQMRTQDVPLCTIHTVEKIGGASSKGEHAYGLEVGCKDLRSLRFAFKQEGHSRRVMHEKLQTAAFPASNNRKFFAYEYIAETKASAAEGWSLYNTRAELHRIGVPGDGWRVSSTNESYQFCATYPAYFAVPSAVTDQQLDAVASFRSRNRIPILSWLHPDNHASITRSAQPLVGKLGKHSREDEAYIEEIAKANPNSQKLVVMDARPKLNAIANKALGGGYEDEEHYNNMELIFLDIGNIHVMRDSMRKLRDICYPTIDDAHWLSNLENTHWLENIKLILAGAVRMVDLVDRCRISVLVHCSDGWDRTAQLCSLAMLLMDPYYRTIVGFEILIEKEWLSLGHKFGQRYGHGDRRAGDEQRAPIFIQFIDAVWQVMHQFPCAFEFNELFLLTILDHLYSCLFGTFLGNCERERIEVQDKTCSLWAHLNEHKEEYMNPLYSSYMHSHVLYPVASIRRLQLWVGYYARWNPRMRPQESEHDRTIELYQLCLQLQRQCGQMQRQIDTQQGSATWAWVMDNFIHSHASTQIPEDIHVMGCYIYTCLIIVNTVLMKYISTKTKRLLYILHYSDTIVLECWPSMSVLWALLDCFFFFFFMLSCHLCKDLSSVLSTLCLSIRAYVLFLTVHCLFCSWLSVHLCTYVLFFIVHHLASCPLCDRLWPQECFKANIVCCLMRGCDHSVLLCLNWKIACFLGTVQFNGTCSSK